MSKLRMSMMTAAVLLALAAAAAERGTDGELRMLYWQAPSIANPFLSGGTKDIHAAAFVLEPLARYDENGNMVPTLAAEIPPRKTAASRPISSPSPGSSGRV